MSSFTIDAILGHQLPRVPSLPTDPVSPFTALKLPYSAMRLGVHAQLPQEPFFPVQLGLNPLLLEHYHRHQQQQMILKAYQQKFAELEHAKRFSIDNDEHDSYTKHSLRSCVSPQSELDSHGKFFFANLYGIISVYDI